VYTYLYNNSITAHYPNTHTINYYNIIYTFVVDRLTKRSLGVNTISHWRPFCALGKVSRREDLRGQPTSKSWRWVHVKQILNYRLMSNWMFVGRYSCMCCIRGIQTQNIWVKQSLALSLNIRAKYLILLSNLKGFDTVMFCLCPTQARHRILDVFFAKHTNLKQMKR